MDISGGRSVCLVLVIIGIIVHPVASDSPVCRVQERPNMGLSRIEDPAHILSVAYEYQSAPDCYHACCNFTESQCNAVSFYAKESLCMMISCQPFRSCVWVTADGFTAARMQITPVAEGPPPPPDSPSIGDPMVSSTTSQQPLGLTTSQALAEGVTSTTTQVTTIITTATATTTTTNPNGPGGLETSNTQPVNPDTLPNSLENMDFSEASDWNMDNGDNMLAETTAIELLSTVKPADSSEQTTTPAVQGDLPAIQGADEQPDDQQPQQQHFDDIFDSQSFEEWQSPNLDAPAPSNPTGESSLTQPVSLPAEGEGSNTRSRGMKRMLIQSPGIIIGLCSALGVAFLVLLAVCRKVYLSHDRPRYKPLRDYDIRFEPPAASSALLP